MLKLWKAGIVCSLWRWFREYLSKRYQHICINNGNSSTLPVISGVPQGSLLGPLLFLLYINDLPSSLKYSNIFPFADDTKYLRPICSPHDCILCLLQSDHDVLSSWSMDWKLMFNESKINVLSYQLLPVCLLNRVIISTSSTGYQFPEVNSKRTLAS